MYLATAIFSVTSNATAIRYSQCDPNLIKDCETELIIYCYYYYYYCSFNINWIRYCLHQRLSSNLQICDIEKQQELRQATACTLWSALIACGQLRFQLGFYSRLYFKHRLGLDHTSKSSSSLLFFDEIGFTRLLLEIAGRHHESKR